MSERDRIVEQLAELDQLSAYRSEPDNPHAGAVWPVLRELNRAGVMCAPYVRTYDVFALLSASSAGTAADEAEQLIEQLVEALEPLGEWVEPAETVQLAIGNGAAMPALRVRITPDPER